MALSHEGDTGLGTARLYFVLYFYELRNPMTWLGALSWGLVGVVYVMKFCFIYVLLSFLLRRSMTGVLVSPSFSASNAAAMRFSI